MKYYLELIDQLTRGPRYDVTPIFNDARGFSDLIDDLIRLCDEIEFDLVAAIDALGFIPGVGIALRVSKPLSYNTEGRQASGRGGASTVCRLHGRGEIPGGSIGCVALFEPSPYRR